MSGSTSPRCRTTRILPPSTTFAPDNNEGRYDAWSTALNASPSGSAAPPSRTRSTTTTRSSCTTSACCGSASRSSLPAVRRAADARPARPAVRGEQAAALHGRRLRPRGRRAEDLVRRRHPAPGRPAAGQPQRRRRDRRRDLGEVLQQRRTPAAPASVTPAGRSSSPAPGHHVGQLVREELDLLRHDRRVPHRPGRRPGLPRHLRRHGREGGQGPPDRGPGGPEARPPPTVGGGRRRVDAARTA